MQEEENVIAYFSKDHTKAERNYCVTRKELLAMVRSIQNYHHYLYGRKFKLRTDHSSLRFLLNFKCPEGQLARWIELLATYDYDIEYRPGPKHINADALSRRPCDEGCHWCIKATKKDAEAFERQEKGMKKVRYTRLKCTRCHRKGHSTATCWRLNVPPIALAFVIALHYKVEDGITDEAMVDDSYTDSEVMPHVFAVRRSQNKKTPWLDGMTAIDWRKAQLDDKVIGQVITLKESYTQKPKWGQISNKSPAVKSYWAQWDRLCMKIGT